MLEELSSKRDVYNVICVHDCRPHNARDVHNVICAHDCRSYLECTHGVTSSEQNAIIFCNYCLESKSLSHTHIYMLCFKYSFDLCIDGLRLSEAVAARLASVSVEKKGQTSASIWTHSGPSLISGSICARYTQHLRSLGLTWPPCWAHMGPSAHNIPAPVYEVRYAASI